MLQPGGGGQPRLLFAAKHWVETEDGKGYVETPKATRGIPHHLVPGVHACFDEYLEALEHVRRTAQNDVSAVDSIMVLPCSPWAQALPPVLEATADLSTRLCVRDPTLASVVSGCAYLPDATDERDALLREPLFRRPSQTSVSDNPWTTSYEYMDTFFNAANHLVLLARQLNVKDDNPISSLWCAMNDFVTQDGSTEDVYPDDYHGRAHAIFAADALLLLSCMYPSTWSVSHDMIHPTWAAAVPALHQHVRATGMCAPLCQLVDEELLAQGRQWWKPFAHVRRAAEDRPRRAPVLAQRVVPGEWRAPAPRRAARARRPHNVSPETRDRVRTALEKAVQAAWLVHSPDGVQRPPVECLAHEAATPADVRRPHDRPHLCRRREPGHRRARLPRRPQALPVPAGVHAGDGRPHRRRALPGGAQRGRPQPPPLVGRRHSQGRRHRAVGEGVLAGTNEADDDAFGTRADKIVGCRDQRAAWDANVSYLAPVFAEVRPPLPRERRMRGKHGTAWGMQQYATEQRMEQQQVTDTEAKARAAFEAAVCSDAARPPSSTRPAMRQIRTTRATRGATRGWGSRARLRQITAQRRARGEGATERVIVNGFCGRKRHSQHERRGGPDVLRVGVCAHPRARLHTRRGTG